MKFTLSMYVRDSLKLWLSCLLELLLFLPVLILFRVYLLPEGGDHSILYLLPLFSLVGVLLRNYCNVRWKKLLIGSLLGVAYGMLIGISIYSVPLAIAGFCCAFLGMNAISRNNSQLYWVGIAGYFVATIVFHRIPELQPFNTLLTWSGSLSLVLTLLISNTNHLRYSSLSEENNVLPKRLQLHNRLHVGVIVIAGLLLATGAGKTIGLWLWNVIRFFFRQLFSKTSEPKPQEVAPPNVVSQFPLVAESEPGLLAAILDIVVYIVGAVAIGVVAYFALRWLYRNAGEKWRRAIDALLAMLRKEHAPKNNSAYQDEEKSVFTWEKTLRGFKDFWSKQLTPKNRLERWDQIHGERERVRWLYRRWLEMKRDSGYEVKRFLTPKETGIDVLAWAKGNKHQRRGEDRQGTAPDQLLKLYNEVRYGDEVPSEADVAALKDQLKL